MTEIQYRHGVGCGQAAHRPVGAELAVHRRAAGLQPAACHVTEPSGNNRVEADHGRLKARLRPMRGLKRLATAAVVAGGHAFVQNLRRGHHELGTDVAPQIRLTAAFAELALAM